MDKFTLKELHDFQIKVTNADFKAMFGTYELWHKFLDVNRSVVTLHFWVYSDRNTQKALNQLIRKVLSK